MKKTYIDVMEVSESMGISKSKAYEIIRLLNSELKISGYITVAGKCPKKYFEERSYGYSKTI